MLRICCVLVAPVLAIILTLTACPAPNDAESTADPTDDAAGEDGLVVDDVLPRGAAAVCGLLFSCCDDTLAAYFAPVAQAEPQSVFFDLKDRVPPAATLTEDECPALVAEIHRRKGLGPFVEAARDGLLTFNAEGLQGCLQTIEEATCGAAARDAVFDSTCFGLQAPEGGALQRRAFSRTTVEGECRPLADGFGGLFFGSCDPTRAFCCVVDGSGECGIPGPEDEGTCTATAQVGEACSPFAPVLPCATGLECIPGAGPGGRDGCLAPSTTALALGDACYDGAQFRLLGQCTDGWCDILGSDVCEPLVPRGGACANQTPCGVGGACVDGVCADDAICGG